ncbi:MAG TPA: helix-hairpin-helix domain-containing protein [Desulfobacteria bacterium]|nr:helix-hairpin-helix domain-containing protein [Desulfobacteria bacterium]
MDRKQLLLAAVLLSGILVGSGYKLAQIKMISESKPVITVNQDIKEKKGIVRQVTVYITGAVKKPGVYTFLEGARIIEGIKKADLAADAAVEYVNLAEPMTDSQHINVPHEGEIQEDAQLQGFGTVTGTTGIVGRPGKININTATKETLDGLPGVGPSTAEKIIEYRQTHGKFKSVSDLMNVSGIGEKKLAKFKDKVTV